MKMKFQVKLRRLKVQPYENDTGPSNWTNWSPATTLCATDIILEIEFLISIV
jgi:hypothetical protein